MKIIKGEIMFNDDGTKGIGILKRLL